MQPIIIPVGIIVLLGIGFLISENRKAINYRTVLGALGIQASIAAFVIFIPAGKAVLLAVSNSVLCIMDYSAEGITFIFGDLGRSKLGFIFAFHVLPVMIFFASLMSVLYYLGIMQRVVRVLGIAMQKALQTSPAESMGATANIFVGNSDVFILMRPYAPSMTKSELFALMTGGLASVSGAVMVGYASLGIEVKYLVAAAFMSAPGGILMAKLIYPETDKPTDIPLDIYSDEDKPVNVIEAATNGAISGLNLAVNVGAMMLALIALIALFNGMLGGITGLFGLTGITLQSIFGYLFAPFALLLGIPADELVSAGGLLGQKLVLNEFVAYVSFLEVKDTLSAHSQIVITMALAGFANLSTPAALIGVLGGLVPKEKRFIAKMTAKVIVAGTLSNFMSASLVGLFISIAG